MLDLISASISARSDIRSYIRSDIRSDIRSGITSISHCLIPDPIRSDTSDIRSDIVSNIRSEALIFDPISDWIPEPISDLISDLILALLFDLADPSLGIRTVCHDSARRHDSAKTTPGPTRACQRRRTAPAPEA